MTELADTTREALSARVARVDPERWRAARLAARPDQGRLAVLYAFNYEIARVRETVSDPILGAIRLQWWREALGEIYAGGGVRRHEVATPLAELIRAADLPQAPFEALINAREKDLEPEPFATLADLTAYADATSSGLMALAAQSLCPAPEFNAAARAAIREAGLAWAFAGILRAHPFWAAQGRNLMPVEFAAELGCARGDIAPEGPAFALAAERLANIAANHHRLARSLGGALPQAALPAIAYGALVPGLLQHGEAMSGFARWRAIMGAVIRGRV